MSIRVSMTYLLDTNGVLPEYRPAFEKAVSHGFSKAVILWDGPDGIEIRYCKRHEGRMPYGATRCQGYFSTVGEGSSCDASDYLLVDAALGTTEDTE